VSLLEQLQQTGIRWFTTCLSSPTPLHKSQRVRAEAACMNFHAMVGPCHLSTLPTGLHVLNLAKLKELEVKSLSVMY
jgi:hypothetical protein